MQKGIEINGAVFADEGDLNHEEFLEEFVKFVESKGWHFGGSTKPVDEEGNYIRNK